MIATAWTNRLRWLACLPTRLLAGWLLLAVLMGGTPAADTDHHDASPAAAASAAQQPSDHADPADTVTERAETGPVTVSVVVVWRPIEQRRGTTLPPRLVQRGPPRF